ncbi:MAG: protein kinase [Roseiflexaceae bacterium]|nr:protein kinase [Roseiflexaceae bacterium]
MSANARSRTKTTSSPSARAPGEPRELLNYRLAERIAQDELATIYRGTHLTLDRPVDVHMLRRTDWVSSSRFQLAARLAARLSHPNILPVIDAGHDERYGDYIVTPRIDGRPLDAVLAEAPLDPLLALRVFSQLGAALDYMHQQSVAHRDVRPENITLTPQGIAYLTNFSLAHAPDTPDLSSIEEADYLTAYSAPEQSLTGGELRPASDLYSLGALLYTMISGELPPAAGQPIKAQADRDPTLAGADRVIRRLLSVQPGQRFANAEQAATALRQSLRRQIDASTDDMEESRWETTAEWLENPVESVIGDLIDHEFLGKSRARADALHRSGALRRTLDRWSRQGFLRKPALGQVVQPEQIVSYNLYAYELRVHYETRAKLVTRERVYKGEPINPQFAELALWEVPVPELDGFVDAPAEVMVIAGSQKIMSCGECNGVTQVICKQCAGKGTVEKTRRIKEADGSARSEAFAASCGVCQGYGKVACPRCEAAGQLLQEKTFTWSRQGRAFFNEDDVADYQKLAVQTQAQEVFRQPIDAYAPRWYQIAPLKELLESVINGGGPDSRLIAAELIIRGTPVTEIDYQLKGRQHSLALIGAKDEVRGDLSLFDAERALLYGAIALLALALVLVLIFFR